MPASNENLVRRSHLLNALRLFFLERDFVEVETPLLSSEVIPEQHIELVQATRSTANSRVATQHTAHWLQASPELYMKRLVAAGMHKIFQVTRSFRSNEIGKLHNPEFTIVEWYRVGDDMQTGMDLLDELLQATMSAQLAMRTSYAQAFEQHVGVNPHRANIQELAALGVVPPAGMKTDDRDEWLNLLLATLVEPQLGRSAPELLYDYPTSQAALATTAVRESGDEVAERFELYWQGVELANGYHELTDADQLRRRLEAVNQAREDDKRPALPQPESLLQAMEGGLPACSGCALGFDRLAMLACGTKSIEDVMPFRDSTEWL